MGHAAIKRLLFPVIVLASVAIWQASSVLAAAPGAIYVNQAGNSNPLPCLLANSAYSGTITVSMTAPGNGTYQLTFGFQPTDTTQPSYNGSTSITPVQQAQASSGGLLVTIPVQGSDGSSASVGNTMTQTTAADGSIMIHFAKSGWTCASGYVP